MKHGIVSEAAMDGIVPSREFLTCDDQTAPAGSSPPRPGGRPGLALDQPGRGERPRRLSSGDPPAGLADPGRGLPMAVATSIWALRQPASTRPWPRSPSTRPIQPRALDPGLARHRPARPARPGIVHPQPHRPAQEPAPGRDGGERPGPGLGSQPARRPRPRAHPGAWWSDRSSRPT